MCGDVELFRGSGLLTEKSAVLLLVSAHPLSALKSAVVLLSPAAAPDPSKQVASLPYPTISTISGLEGQAPDNDVVVLHNAILAPATAMSNKPVASGVGKGDPLPPAPAFSCIK